MDIKVGGYSLPVDSDKVEELSRCFPLGNESKHNEQIAAQKSWVVIAGDLCFLNKDKQPLIGVVHGYPVWHLEEDGWWVSNSEVLFESLEEGEVCFVMTPAPDGSGLILATLEPAKVDRQTNFIVDNLRYKRRQV